MKIITEFIHNIAFIHVFQKYCLTLMVCIQNIFLITLFLLENQCHHTHLFFHFSYEGYTPLSRASRAGKDEIVSFLLSIKGVSPNKRNKERVFKYYKCTEFY